ncbi:MAG: SLC13 family permease [Acidobacteriota bacterium]|nr:MAG: SLC13 family permease [Acidobacteriota bacterium]
MWWESVLVLVVFSGALYLFAREIMRPDLVALLVMAVLMVFQLVTVEEGVAGFSNPAVITVVMMFLLSAGLVKTGVADFMGKLISTVGGGHPLLLTATVMLAVGAMSCFMNNIAATVILIPAVMAAARRAELAPTKLLIPLSFGSLLGGLCTLIGTPPNLLINIALEGTPHEPFRMFDYVPTGLAITGVSVVYMVVWGHRVLPARQPTPQTELADRYEIEDYLSELVMLDDSPWVGKALGRAQLGRMGLEVLKILRGDIAIFLPPPHEVLRSGDVLVVEGSAENLMEIKKIKGVQMRAEEEVSPDVLLAEELALSEVSLPPNSISIGKSVRSLQFRTRYGVVVLAIRRGTRTLHRALADEELQAGDVLLVEGPSESIRGLVKDPNFLVIGHLNYVFHRTEKAWHAVGVMAIVVALAGFGIFHISLAAVLGVLLMVLTGCMKVEEMYREIDWQVVFLIAGMIPLSTAMEKTGIISAVAGGISTLGGAGSGYVAFALLFLASSALTQVLSNPATAVLVAPVAVQVADGLGVSPYPLLMAVAIACSATFLTPIGHQANLLVYGLGGYRFKDFAKIGLPLTVILFFFCLWWVPRVWPF